MELWDILLIAISFIFVIAGLIGCILPIMPGPPIAFIGILIYNYVSFSELSSDLLLLLFAIILVVTLLDFVIPIFGTKKYGGSKYGIYGGSIGLILGLFILPPFGILLGPFLGAFIGELLFGRTQRESFRAAWGSFVGLLFGTLLKVASCILIMYYIIVDLF